MAGMAACEDGVFLPPASQWQHLFGSYADLVAHVEQWPVTDRTPEAVATMLATSRALFTHMWFVYEFGIVAVAWSLLAIEAMLRHRLDATDLSDRRRLAGLLTDAKKAELLSAEWAGRLEAARKLRNEFAHGRMTGLLTPGMVSQMVQAAHDLAAWLFPDATGERL
jgi:hypothetical protein